MKNLYLIGFMGTGKSAVARMLAREHGCVVLEMDEEIERREGRTIPEIFARNGEEYFRDLESSLLEELAADRAEQSEYPSSDADIRAERTAVEAAPTISPGEEGVVDEGISTRAFRVISCGGGVVLREENVALMKQNGQVILLSAEPEAILARVSRSDNRPLLAGKSPEEVRALIEERRANYEAAADEIIDTTDKSVREVAEEVCKKSQIAI